MRGVLVAFALVAGCYDPAIDDCAYRCSGVACPAGMKCDPAGFCRTIPVPATSCMPTNGDDGGSDASTCGFGTFVPTHFNSCDIAVETQDWIINGNEMYDTISGAVGAPAGVMIAQVPPGSTNVRVVRVNMFRVEPSANLTLTGPVPLIIVADTVLVDGQIIVDTGVNAIACAPAMVGSLGSGCTSGGYGGGFGGSGGTGGPCQGVTPIGTTPESGDATQTDLRGGCKGGDANGSPATLGGNGGGALQISASVSIRITGIIAAPGRGGLGGMMLVGGGGGGSGGAIFLEAPSIDITTGARVCANGAAGGEGSSSSLSASGTCNNSAALSSNNSPGGDGGAGSHASMINGSPGGNGGSMGCAGQPCGGGGGGGGVGRIRLRTNSPMNLGTVTPMAVP